MQLKKTSQPSNRNLCGPTDWRPKIHTKYFWLSSEKVRSICATELTCLPSLADELRTLCLHPFGLSVKDPEGQMYTIAESEEGAQ